MPSNNVQQISRCRDSIITDVRYYRSKSSDCENPDSVIASFESCGSSWKQTCTPIAFISAIYTGVIMLINAITLGSLLYTGTLKQYMWLGIQQTCIGTMVLQLGCAAFSSFEVYGVTSTFEAVFFSKAMTADITARMKNDPPEAILATAMVANAMLSLVGGLTLLTMSHFKALAKLPNYIPLSVSNGLFAAIGWVLFSMSFESVTGLALTFDTSSIFSLFYFQKENLLWIGSVSAGAVLFFLKMRLDSPYVMLFWFVCVLSIAHVVRIVQGVSMHEAELNNYMMPEMKPKPMYTFYSSFDWGLVNTSVLFSGQIWQWLLLGMVFGPVLNTSLNLTVFEAATIQLLDANKGQDLLRELKVNGAFLALAGLLFGYPSNVAITSSNILQASGGSTRLSSILIGLFLMGMLAFHWLMAFVHYIPFVLGGGLLVYMGTNMMYRSFLGAYYGSSRSELLVSIIVTAFGIVGDISQGFIAGLVCSSFLVVFETSTKGFVMEKRFGSHYPLPIVRSFRDQRLLRVFKFSRFYVRLKANFLFYAPAQELTRELARLFDYYQAPSSRETTTDDTYKADTVAVETALQTTPKNSGSWILSVLKGDSTFPIPSPADVPVLSSDTTASLIPSPSANKPPSVRENVNQQFSMRSGVIRGSVIGGSVTNEHICMRTSAVQGSAMGESKLRGRVTGDSKLIDIDSHLCSEYVRYSNLSSVGYMMIDFEHVESMDDTCSYLMVLLPMALILPP